MTFLLPFSMLKKGWGKKFRGLAKFDLSTGLFIPFLLATSCVVIAAGSQFHGKAETFLTDPEVRAQVLEDNAASPSRIKTINGTINNYNKNLDKLADNLLGEELATLTTQQEKHDETIAAAKEAAVKAQGQEKADALAKEDKTFGKGEGPLALARKEKLKDVTESDQILAAMLIKRDAAALADSLQHLAGPGVAQIVFGIGVVGMAISTIIILMLINGFTICEMLGKPSKGWLHRCSCLLPAVTGALGFIYLWGNKDIPDAKFYLAVPTSRFGMVLLPVAYLAFFFLMNSRKVLGDELPTGIKRLTWNVLMLIGLALALIGAGVSIMNEKSMVPGTEIKVQHLAFGVMGAMLILGIIIHFVRAGKQKAD
jgi:hypothetical protein